MENMLPVLWALILAFTVVMYVVLDGFDLGIGILFRFVPGERSRDTMMSAIAPVWDGNETWLVLGGSVLFAAFPVAYAAMMPAFYLPLIVMLVALIFRGVAFEFRERAVAGRHWWDRAFCYGSMIATFAQGVVLGSFVQGVSVSNGAFVGTAFEWLTPFALFCGAALIAGYALLGCTWLLMKTAGDLQGRMRRAAMPLLVVVMAAVGVISLWTPLIRPEIADRWFSWPNIAFLSPVPLLTGLIAFGLLRALRRGREVRPFVYAVLLFLLAYLGLGISLFPAIVPPDISVWEAASPPTTQRFLLWGAGLVLPVVLVYTVYSYWVFRGRASAVSGYH